MPFAPWRRPRFTASDGQTVVEFVVYAPRPLPLTFDLEAEGSPVAELPLGIAVQLFERRLAAEFSDWADSLSADGECPAGLEEAACWYVVGGTMAGAPDLVALQAAWAAVRVLCRAGGLAVWDSLAVRWQSPEAVLATNPALPALAAAWAVECSAVDHDELVAVHTLGLAKFARRDLVAFAPPAGAEALRGLIGHLALDLIEGVVFAPGDRITAGGAQLEIADYLPGKNGPETAIPFFASPLLVLLRG